MLQLWSRNPWKHLIVPGGILLLIAVIVAHSGWAPFALPSLSFLYYCATIGGMLLAWRFHSSRTFLALLALFLAEQALALSGAAHATVGTPGSIALRFVALLIPLNFILISFMQERGFTLAAIATAGMFLFVQSIVVIVLCNITSGFPSASSHSHHTAVTQPDYALFVFVAGGVCLLVRAFFTRKPVDSALFWSLSAFFLSLRFLGAARTSTAYSAAAAAILATSIIENSYLLAYHDELTTLPSRRAFNDAMLRLQETYSIAVVDIDHFKRFNDTYGHDTGDQVLRLVATNLSRVTGGGQAYRCGGEEFAILFPGRTIPEVLDHLEQLRAVIEISEFRMRSTDRRQVPRGPDRRNERSRGRSGKGHAIRQLAHEKPIPLAVTVSIGVANNTKDNPRPDLVLEAADKALYRAKANGRNRIETATAPRRSRARAAGIA